jgi:hypothetical protein
MICRTTVATINLSLSDELGACTERPVFWNSWMHESTPFITVKRPEWKSPFWAINSSSVILCYPLQRRHPEQFLCYSALSVTAETSWTVPLLFFVIRYSGDILNSSSVILRYPLQRRHPEQFLCYSVLSVTAETSWTVPLLFFVNRYSGDILNSSFVILRYPLQRRHPEQFVCYSALSVTTKQLVFNTLYLTMDIHL